MHNNSFSSLPNQFGEARVHLLKEKCLGKGRSERLDIVIFPWLCYIIG